MDDLTPSQKETMRFIRSITSSYIKDFARVSSTPDKPFKFIEVMVMEAHEYSWYQDLVGTKQLVYLHGYVHEDGSFEIDHYCAFRWIKKDRIEITGKFKKEHLDI
jgi:hypothetical protein